MPTTHVSMDFNGDGHSDAFLYNPTTHQATDWLSNSNGSFTPNSAETFSYDPLTSYFFGFGDFNGDGIADMVTRNMSTGEVDIWLGNKSGGFTETDATNSIGTEWRIVATGDFNGDGYSDILFRNSSGYIAQWDGTANGLVPNAVAGNGSADSSWFLVTTGDYNGDGKTDLVWENGQGYVTEWLGQANGSFLSNEANAGTGSAAAWDLLGSGDFNGDGKSDLLWRDDSTGYVTEWLGTTNGGFVSNNANAGTGAADPGWGIVGLGDYNGDGRSDILWRNLNSGYVTEWLANSDGGFSSNQAIAGTPLDPSWSILRFI